MKLRDGYYQLLCSNGHLMEIDMNDYELMDHNCFICDSYYVYRNDVTIDEKGREIGHEELEEASDGVYRIPKANKGIIR